MNGTWQVQDAKAKFSELLAASLEDGPQIVTKRGVETAVLVSMETWQHLQALTRPSLRDCLLAPEARTETLTPARRPYPYRSPSVLE